MLPLCGMGGGSVMNGAVICGYVLYARNHLSIKMSVGIVLLFMRVCVSTAAQRWTVNNKISPPFPGGDLFD